MSDEIPVKDHQCLAVRHVEDVAAEVEELRREVRASERHTSDRITQIWIRLGCLTLVMGLIAPEIVKKILEMM